MAVSSGPLCPVLVGSLSTRKNVMKNNKIGRPKNIESPEILWSLFTEYRNKTKDTPFLEHDFVGKDGDSVFRQRERCLTLEGFENYVEDQGVINDFGDYFRNKDGRYPEFAAICSRVRRHIRQDQIEGGMAGIYNPSITQRLNGLVEKSAVTVTEQQLFPDVKPDKET